MTGIRVGIQDSGDAEMVDFDIMYADFMYQNDQGSLELPLVRGSAMLTHIFNNANPIITPYCLTAINGENVSYECPEEETSTYISWSMRRIECYLAKLKRLSQCNFYLPVLPVRFIYIITSVSLTKSVKSISFEIRL